MNNQNEMRFVIDGMALKQETSEVDNWLPDVKGHPQYPPYNHQVQMRDLIENKEAFVATNSTITGGGKTESYAIPTMNNNLFTIVVFPTNALTTDQRQGIQELADNYYFDKNVFIKQLTSNKMQEYRESERKKGNLNKSSLTNSQQILQSLIHAERNDGPSFILTNPDIFVEIINGSYGAKVRQHLEMADIAVVDEFHHAQEKGRNALVIKMDELYHRPKNKCNLNKFIFLSATPDETLGKQLDTKFGRSSDTDLYHHIDSKEHCKSVSELDESEPYNPVMPTVNTRVIGGRPFSTKRKILSEDYFEQIIDFIKDGRSIIILDGVAEVKEVHDVLQSVLPNKRVEKITGIMSENTHDKLQNGDILVANSTLEVGVNIGDIENLIFSGFNASSFMQRLGRLRAKPNMLEKSAICFTKPDALESFKMFNELEPDAVQRNILQSTVNRQLDTSVDPKIYRTEFTPVEFYYAARKRAESMQEGSEEYKKLMHQLISKHCFELSEYDIRQEDVDKLWSLSHTKLAEAMQSYRQSSLTTLYYDVRTGTVKTYSTPNILRMGNVEFLTELEFDHRLKQVGIEDPSIYDGEKRYVQSYAWFHGFMDSDKLRNPHLAPTDQVQNMLSVNPQDRYPEIINSLEFHVDNTTELSGLNVLNKQIKTNLNSDSGPNIVGYATEGHPAQIQTIYGLDEFFFTNPIANMNGEYTMALGENAQYMYCYVQENMRAAEELYKQARRIPA